jgi:hypothetical protein
MNLYFASRRPIDVTKDSRLNWGKLASEGYSLHRIDATNSGQMFVEPHIKELASYLGEAVIGNVQPHG